MPSSCHLDSADVEASLGLRIPWPSICRRVEHGVSAQVLGARLDGVVLRGRPMFVAYGHHVLTHTGICVRANLEVSFAPGRRHEIIDAALTFLFAGLDHPGRETLDSHFDLGAPAAQGFTADRFEERFHTFLRDPPPRR
jgi:hypothetical protein